MSQCPAERPIQGGVEYCVHEDGAGHTGAHEWPGGPSLAQRIATSEARALAAEKKRDEIRQAHGWHIAETCRLAEEGGEKLKAALSRALEAERRLKEADRWILDRAAYEGREEHRDDPYAPYPEGLLWDAACQECTPFGELVKPGFRCAVHAAHARALSSPATHDETKGEP